MPSNSSQVYAIPVRLKLNASRIIRVGESISVIMSHTSGWRDKGQQLKKENKPTVIAIKLNKRWLI
jgi:methionine-rich copper-binding protein CopC